MHDFRSLQGEEKLLVEDRVSKSYQAFMIKFFQDVRQAVRATAELQAGLKG